MIGGVMEATIFTALGAIMVARNARQPWLTAIAVTCGVAIGSYLSEVL